MLDNTLLPDEPFPVRTAPGGRGPCRYHYKPRKGRNTNRNPGVWRGIMMNRMKKVLPCRNTGKGGSVIRAGNVSGRAADRRIPRWDRLTGGGRDPSGRKNEITGRRKTSRRDISPALRRSGTGLKFSGERKNNSAARLVNPSRLYYNDHQGSRIGRPDGAPTPSGPMQDATTIPHGNV